MSNNHKQFLIGLGISENLKRHLWKEKEESTQEIVVKFLFRYVLLVLVYFSFDYVFHSQYSSPFIVTTNCLKLHNGRYVTCPYVYTCKQ